MVVYCCVGWVSQGVLGIIKLSDLKQCRVSDLLTPGLVLGLSFLGVRTGSNPYPFQMARTRTYKTGEMI
jgi:hypothetical protein